MYKQVQNYEHTNYKDSHIEPYLHNYYLLKIKICYCKISY